MPNTNPLSTEEYYVKMDDEARRAHAKMMEAEEDWLESAAANGCTVQKMDELVATQQQRRFLVLVPPGVTIPSHEEMQETRVAAATIYKELAALQGKKPTIGDRSTNLPKWIDGSSIEDAKPDFEASSVTYRTQKAYRGGVIKPSDAIQILRDQIAKMEEQEVKATKARQHKRAEAIKDKVSKEREVLDNLLAFLEENPGQYSIRLISGIAITVSARGDGMQPASETLSNVLMVPATKDCTLSPAASRNRPSRYEVVETFGRFEVVKL